MKNHPLRFKQTQLALYMAVCICGLANTHSWAEEQVLVSAQLPTITVYTEQLSQTAANVKNINRNSLDQTGVQKMADVVKYLPLVQAPFSVYGGGTYIDSAGTSSYNIRGLDANRIGLDIDGVDIAEASISPFMPPGSMRKRGAGRDYIEPEMLQSVDIRSGSSDVETDGLGGRVSFKNKSPQDYIMGEKSHYAAAKAGYSTVDQAWLSAITAAAGNEKIKALVAYAHREGHETDGNSKTKAFDADWDLDAVLGSINWNLNPEHQLNLSLDRYQKKSLTSGIDPTAFNAFKSDDARQQQTLERTTYALEEIYQPQASMLLDQLKSKLWYQQSENATRTVYDQGSYIRDFYNHYQQDSTGLKLDAEKQINLHRMKYGFNFEQKDYSSDRADIRSNGQKAPFDGTYLTDSTLKRYALYFSDQLQFEPQGKALTITPSIRIEQQQYRPEASGSNIQDRDFNYVAPGLSLSYQLTPAHYSYVKYARAARIPSPMEMGGSYETSNGATYLVMGNSNLKKETSDSFEIGMHSTVMDGLRFDISGFYNRYQDFIDYYNYGNSIPGYFLVYRAENIADAEIWGGEISSRLDLGKFVAQAEGFSLALVAGKSHGQAKSKTGEKSGLNSVQPEKGSLTFAYDAPDKKYGLGLTATAVGAKQALKDVSSLQSDGEVALYPKVAGYTVFDLSAYWNLNPSTRLNLAANNLFDKTYWNYASVSLLNTQTSAVMIDRAAEPGRNIVASLEFKF